MPNSAKKTTDLNFPTKTDGTKDKRFSTPQFT